MMPTIPIRVFSGIGQCNQAGHEIVFITNGVYGYAYGKFDAVMQRVAGTLIAVDCCEDTDDGQCQGFFQFDLEDESGWNSVPTTIALLVCEGVEIGA